MQRYLQNREEEAVKSQSSILEVNNFVPEFQLIVVNDAQSYLLNECYSSESRSSGPIWNKNC